MNPVTKEQEFLRYMILQMIEEQRKTNELLAKLLPAEAEVTAAEEDAFIEVVIHVEPEPEPAQEPEPDPEPETPSNKSRKAAK